MSVTTKRKDEDEGRFFNNQWCSKCLIVPINQGIDCRVCLNTIAVNKDILLNTTTHSSQHDEILGQARVDKI